MKKKRYERICMDHPFRNGYRLAYHIAVGVDKAIGYARQGAS